MLQLGKDSAARRHTLTSIDSQLSELQAFNADASMTACSVQHATLTHAT
jgi:hypothetical protein